MGTDDIIKDLAAACQIEPQDPGARGRLIAHCKEEATKVSGELVEVLANLARTQEGREEILEADMLSLLVQRGLYLQEEITFTQVCRLGGNLCYDSPEGRLAVQQANLLPALTAALPSIGASSESKLWQVLPAFLHNFCADSPTCLNSVSSLIEVTASHFSHLTEESGGVGGWSSLLAGLTQHEGNLLLFARPDVMGSVLHLLHLTRDGETLQTLLELLQEICEDETISVTYLNLGLHQILVNRLHGEEWEDVATCLDILALISSHQLCLEVLLSPSSPLPPLLPLWLSSGDSRTAATAALIYGNYCTSDSACSELALSNSMVPATLVTLLHPDSDPKLLHAVVGCLRNLSVCGAARELLCSLFLPQACTQLLLHLGVNNQHTVTPKLVGTLRLVTQGDRSACSELGSNKDLLACLVRISQFSLVPALAIETARLMASIVRYSEDVNILVSCLEVEGSLYLLTSLLNSPHPQLINEVLVVLNIGCATNPAPPSLVQQLDLSFIFLKITSTLNMASCPPQIKANALLLAHTLLLWPGERPIQAARATEGFEAAVSGLQGMEEDIMITRVLAIL